MARCWAALILLAGGCSLLASYPSAPDGPARDQRQADSKPIPMLDGRAEALPLDQPPPALDLPPDTRPSDTRPPETKPLPEGPGPACPAWPCVCNPTLTPKKNGAVCYYGFLKLKYQITCSKGSCVCKKEFWPWDQYTCSESLLTQACTECSPTVKNDCCVFDP
jgi:hypothetical protein